MDREAYYAMMNAAPKLDYELYLNTGRLLACQKPFGDFCNPDELQFQIVHQVEELWMKLAAYTLLEIDEQLAAKHTNKVVTLFGRVHQLIHLMTNQLALLETMSPRDYQAIRLQLGNGSGQESPGFRTLLQMPRNLWETYVAAYLAPQGRTVRDIYDAGYAHDDAYVLAEAMMELDELFQKFRWHHIFLIHRSIGMGASSLKGRSVDLLQHGAQHRFFPELWDVRSHMTDAWGGTYGKSRAALSNPPEG